MSQNITPQLRPVQHVLDSNLINWKYLLTQQISQPLHSKHFSAIILFKTLIKYKFLLNCLTHSKRSGYFGPAGFLTCGLSTESFTLEYLAWKMPLILMPWCWSPVQQIHWEASHTAPKPLRTSQTNNQQLELSLKINRQPEDGQQWNVFRVWSTTQPAPD